MHTKVYCRYFDVIVAVKSLLCQVRLEPEFEDDLVYKLKKIVDSDNFSVQFIQIISHYKDFL